MTAAEILRALPAFSTVDDAALTDLVTELVNRDYQPGDEIVREGEDDDSVYLVLAGTVQVVRSEYTDVELNSLGPADLFGLISLLDQGPRSATCRAATACAIGRWSRKRIAELTTRHPQLALAFELALAAQLVRDFRQLDAKVRARLGARWAIAPDEPR